MAGPFLTGALPSPGHVLAASSPYRLRGATPEQFSVVPDQLSYWNNQKDGCCVTTEEAYAKLVASVLAGKKIFISDQVVYDWANRHGVLNGAVISQVLDWMADDGFQQDGVVYDDGVKSSIDWTNVPAMQNAVANCCPVKIGVAARQLQSVPNIGGRNGWFATGFRRDGKLDHCVSISGYGPMGYLFQVLGAPVPTTVNPNDPGWHLFTWDGIGVIDHKSMLNITGEAWVRNPTNVVQGPTPPPGPPTPPPPSPTPNVRNQIIAVFNQVIATYSAYPRVVRLLRQVEAMVLAQLPANTANALGPVPPDVMRTIGASFAAVEAAFPTSGDRLRMLQSIIDHHISKV